MHERWAVPWWLLRAAEVAALGLFVLAVGAFPSARDSLSDESVDAFVGETAQRWCRAHGPRPDLQIAVVDVHFRAEPHFFSEAEGFVAAPVGIDLAGAQRVVEVASQPADVRRLRPQGIHVLTWTYAGRVNREIRYVGLALVERKRREKVTLPREATFDTLPPDFRPEALARATDTEEHELHKCAAFSEWAIRVAGSSPAADQVARLVRAVKARRDEEECGCDDVCAAVRKGRFTAHEAQVAVVMGAREIGIPALGFASATPRGTHLVGIFTDQLGWTLLDLEQPGRGWWRGGAPLVTMAPLLGEFAASQHGFWRPEGAAYGSSGWGGVHAFSSTKWKGSLRPETRTDTTEARAVPLSEVCR